MYCRQCHYDLRALTTNRCPECGKAFDPANPRTYFAAIPSIAERVWMSYQNTINPRVLIVVLLCLFWLCGLLIPAPSARGLHSPERQYLQASRKNLTSILAVWSEQQNSSPSYVSFNKQIAIGASRPSLSLWTEYDLFERRNQIQQSLTETSIFAFPLATIFGTISLLWRGRVRKVAGVLAILFVLLSASSGAAKFLSTLFVPGTYAFLDDYVYVENIDLHHATGMIAAYDWRGPPQGWPNVLAFDDGRVEILVDEHRARLLFEQQGLAYPEPKERDKDND